MATVDQSGNREFEMTNADTHEILVRKTGYHRLNVGDENEGAADFNGQSINVKQRGNSLKDLDTVAASEEFIVHLIAGYPLQFVPSGAVTTVRIFLIREKSNHAR